VIGKTGKDPRKSVRVKGGIRRNRMLSPRELSDLKKRVDRWSSKGKGMPETASAKGHTCSK
jgi:hypothetical protein